jgi:hypothetical protein
MVFRHLKLKWRYFGSLLSGLRWGLWDRLGSEQVLAVTASSIACSVAPALFQPRMIRSHCLVPARSTIHRAEQGNNPATPTLISSCDRVASKRQSRLATDLVIKKERERVLECSG